MNDMNDTPAQAPLPGPASGPVPGIESMGRQELMDALALARQRLEDVDETFNFMLANTNDHLADAMVLEFEQDLYEHRDIVAALEARIEEIKQAG